MLEHLFRILTYIYEIPLLKDNFTYRIYISTLLFSVSVCPPHPVTVVLLGLAIRKMDQGWHSVNGFEC